MTTNSNHHVDPAAVAKYQQERADAAAQDRLDQVMSSPAYEGREALARTLLGIKEPHRMLAGEIIATLEKAPRISGGEPVAPAASQFNVPPSGDVPGKDLTSRAALLGLTPKQIEDERLYELGAATMRALLGK